MGKHLKYTHDVGHHRFLVRFRVVKVLRIQESGDPELFLDQVEGELQSRDGTLLGRFVEVEQVLLEVVEEGQNGQTVLPRVREISDVHPVFSVLGAECGLTAPGQQAPLKIGHVLEMLAQHSVELPVKDDGPNQRQGDLGIAVDNVDIVDVDKLDAVVLEYSEDGADIAEVMNSQRPALTLQLFLRELFENGKKDESVPEVVVEIRDGDRGVRELRVDPFSKGLLLDVFSLIHVGNGKSFSTGFTCVIDGAKKTPLGNNNTPMTTARQHMQLEIMCILFLFLFFSHFLWRSYIYFSTFSPILQSHNFVAIFIL